MLQTQTFDNETGEIHEGAFEVLLPSVISQEIDVQVATSKRYPRRRDKVIAMAIMDRATLSPDIAAECIYTLPRDGKTITGPSARFAEVVVSCYGNIRVASRFVRIDDDNKMRQAVIVEAVALDTEIGVSRLTQVRRSIMTSGKHGAAPRPFSVDMIATTVQAAMSIAERNATLKLVPKAIWSDGYAQVERVVAGDEKTLGERRKKMILEFGKFNVRPEDIYAALGVEDETGIGLNDMPRLAGMWSQLRDGEAAESVLGMAGRVTATAAVANPMANPATETNGATQTQAAAQARPADPPPAGKDPAPAAAAETAKTETRGRSNKKNAAAQAPAPAPADPPAQAAVAADPVPEKAAAVGLAQDADAQGQGDADFDAKEDSARRDADDGDPFDVACRFLEQFHDTPAALMDWWKRIRDERNKMTFDQKGQLSNLYNAKFTEMQNIEDTKGA